jgi:hypothetical protein
MRVGWKNRFVAERTEDYFLRLHGSFNRRIVQHIGPYDVQSRMFDAKSRRICEQTRLLPCPRSNACATSWRSRSARCSHDQDSCGILVRHGMAAVDGRAESPAGQARMKAPLRREGQARAAS